MRTIVLGATLATLLGGIALVLRHDAREAHEAAAIVTDGITRITIERPDRATLVIARTGDDWRVTAPCAIDADEARITPLLAALGAGGAGYPADEVDLDAAGLATPRATVRLDEEPVRLGGTDLGGERLYARRGTRVVLIPAWTLSLVEGGLSTFAEPTPLDSAPVAIRRANGATITSGTASGDETTLDPAPWIGLTADRIEPWPSPGDLPDPHHTRLEAELSDGARHTLELLDTANATALRVDGRGCAYLFGRDTLPVDALP